MASVRSSRAALIAVLVLGLAAPASGAAPAPASGAAPAPASGAAPAPGTITLGPPLTQPPDVTFGCATVPIATGTAEVFSGDGASCTWTTPENPASPTEALVAPPGDGTITGVRVSVGPTTGPMSFVVLQSERNVLTQAVTCCQAVLVTQPVMPTPNEVNPFRTDLPVHTDAPGEQSMPGVQLTDYLGLAVLNDVTPIPVIDETVLGLPADQLPQDAIEHPAPLQGQTAAPTSTVGYQLDLQAEWVPGTPAPATPRVRFATGRVFVAHGDLHVPLRCRNDTCRGEIAVGGATSPRSTYAEGPFRIGQNLYRSIAVPLTTAGLEASRSRTRLTISITVTYRTPTASKRIVRTLAVRF